jgi:hypothetical protein
LPLELLDADARDVLKLAEIGSVEDLPELAGVAGVDRDERDSPAAQRPHYLTPVPAAA